MAWKTPVTDRKSELSQTTYSDFNRICENMNIVAETSLKTDWTENDIVDEDTWVLLVETCMAYDRTITYSTDYINLNKIEAVARDNYGKSHLRPSDTQYPADDLYPA